MNIFENYPNNFSTQFNLCFDILIRGNIYIFSNQTPAIVRQARSVFIITCVTIYYIVSMGTYFCKVFYGEIDIIEMAFVFPVLVVSFQGK